MKDLQVAIPVYALGLIISSALSGAFGYKLYKALKLDVEQRKFLKEYKQD